MLGAALVIDGVRTYCFGVCEYAKMENNEKKLMSLLFDVNNIYHKAVFGIHNCTLHVVSIPINFVLTFSRFYK